MEKDNTYQAYSLKMFRDVPKEDQLYLIKLFANRASVMIGSSFGEDALNATVELINQYYGLIPICYIGSGFIKGSLGHYGDHKFCPRTINKWLNEISSEYSRDQAKKNNDLNENGASITCDLHKFPAGKAINQKIEWYRSGKLRGNDWDRVSLQRLAEDISMKKAIIIENYL